MGLIAILIGNRFLSKRKQSLVPPALRPGPSDEELERRFFIRQLAIGGFLTLFMAVFLPAYFLREPVRLHERAVEFSAASVSRGADLFAPTGDPNNLTAVGCATCHGLKGEGGVRQFQGHTYAEPPLKYIVGRYLASGRNEEDIKQLIRDAIERGRPGTPMPTWGLQFGGPLNAEQVDDLIAFVYSIQEKPPTATSANGKALFQENCAICHGVDAKGGIGPNLTIEFQRLTEDQVRQTIMGGRLNINRPSMPSWAFLGSDAVDALVNFLKSVQRMPVR
ncbi:MAG: cytochrome c [Actinomycetota bacterium]|nr:c-type cytochrome [Actinomycetota bacterium]